METDKPLVSILLAIYKPNEKWLIEQLISLNEQSYENLELIVYDDCPENPVNEELFTSNITNFSFKIIRGTENKGSNIAFEELTKMGNGEYFAYCDQDDIWEKDKIEKLIDFIKVENAILAYSDMAVIDEKSKLIAQSLKEVRPRLQYIEGNLLYEKFFFRNCVAGCSMIVKADIARKALPFSKVTLHDQWICIIASYYGKIAFLNTTLVKYRIHNDNQTRILSGISSKNDYYNSRVNILSIRSEELKKSIKNIKMNSIDEFCNARINKCTINILKYKNLSIQEAYFEIIIKYIPRWLFIRIIKFIKK
ncbi:MAG: glycosyltransferase [Clostridium neonatale]